MFRELTGGGGVCCRAALRKPLTQRVASVAVPRRAPAACPLHTAAVLPKRHSDARARRRFIFMGGVLRVCVFIKDTIDFECTQIRQG